MKIILKIKENIYSGEMLDDEILTDTPVCGESEYIEGEGNIKPFYTTKFGVLLDVFGKIEITKAPRG